MSVGFYCLEQDVKQHLQEYFALQSKFIHSFVLLALLQFAYPVCGAIGAHAATLRLRVAQLLRNRDSTSLLGESSQ